MGYHILNGDCLAGIFSSSRVGGETIICRECLIEGPVNASSGDRFWELRAQYLSKDSAQEKDFYFRSVKSEYDKLSTIDKCTEISLWFEHDLFCQVNYWFTIVQLNHYGFNNVYRVSPLTTTEGKWEGFCNHSGADLEVCYANKVKFSKGDFTLGENLWQAYREGDIIALSICSKSLSPCFPRLDEVCKAEIERKSNKRPQRALQEIMSNGYTNFNDIFHQFSKKEGIYGFGDAQVNHMLQGLRRM
jgi:hypothetical protein